MASSKHRILLVRLSHLGDVAHALPVFHALRAAHPFATIAWAVQHEFADLVRGLDGLERTIELHRERGARGWLALVRELEDFGATWAVDAQANLKSAFVTLASRAPRRSGLARADWTESFGATALTDEARAVGRSARGGPHAMVRMLALCEHVAPRTSPRFDPGLTTDELQAARAELDALCGSALGAPIGSALDERCGSNRERVCLLHLARAGDPRSWPDDRFEELARVLAGSERVLVASGPSELEQGRALAARLASVTRVAHRPSHGGARALAALCAAVAERGGRFVGCDSGPAHLAASVGLPVVLLAGPQDEGRTGPWPLESERGPHRVVRARSSPTCAPCVQRRCTHPDGNVCMRAITALDVARALGVTT